MNNINNIITTLSPEDKTNFITYLRQNNKRSDTKNIELFKLLSENKLSSKEICQILYNTHSKNAYHALRKRLFSSLIEFTANRSLEGENSVNMQIIKYLIASRTFLEYKQFEIAYKILDKAEALAIEHAMFPLLNEIYHTKIQYAYLNPSIDIDELTAKFTENQKKHHLEDQLNIVYAKMRQILNKISYEGEVVNFRDILDKTLQQHNVTLKASLSFKSLYQLMTIISISAFVTNDFLQIEAFLINSYNSIEKEQQERQLFYHIQVLYMIANTLFRNKKFNQSLAYLDQMNELLLQEKKKHYKSFKLKHSLLSALNHNYSNNQERAIAILEPHITNKHPDIESLLDIHLSLITFYFQQGNFIDAFKLFSKFYHTDNWYTQKAGKEWVIKKNLIEILLHIELLNTDLVESRILSFKRHYFDYLKSIGQKRAITYVQLIEMHYKHPENVRTESFRTLVKSSFTWTSPLQEDIFVMSFYAWLKSKIDNNDLYQTTLNLVKEAQKLNESSK